ncbi:MAG: hypothetical protein ACLR23_08400 [Clostridia bacterium]
MPAACRIPVDCRGIKIVNPASLKEALVRRMDYFVNFGCPASDMAFEKMPQCPDGCEFGGDDLPGGAVWQKADG